MRPLPLRPHTLAPLAAALLALGLSACGSTVSTSAFTGEEHAVAQTIANLQADATAGEQGKICSRDLSAKVVSRLGGMKGCEAAIKTQLTEIDSMSVSVESVKIDQATRTATASVKSTYAGKSRPGTVTLEEEGGSWKVTGF